MAGLSVVPAMTEQFAAMARLRWQLFLHSLRTTRGTMELVSRIFVGLLIAGAGIGGAIGLGAASWGLVSKGSPEWLALILWFVFVFWQFFPVMATAFTESTDSSVFLRFPLNYRAYFLVVLVFGALDIATTLGCIWLAGIFVGVAFADPRRTLWTALVLTTFALVNIVLARTIFSWIERWLAQRRTREIFGVLFFLLIIAFQFMGPLINHYGEHSQPEIMRFGRKLSPAQRLLPPGLAADAIAHSQGLQGAGSLALLCIYAAGFLLMLNLRLRAQYRGENLSETGARIKTLSGELNIRPGWSLPGFSTRTAAIFQKELLYLSRSGPMLFTLVMPVVMITVFRFGGAGAGNNGGLLMRAPSFAFPMGAIYAVLVLTNLVYNNFGADGGGIQFFFALPVRFRQIVLAKNLAHLAVLAIELLLVWTAVFFLYRPPTLDVSMATIAALFFAIPVNFSVGNLLSIYSPKKIEYGTFGRQRASQTTILISFLVQIVVFGSATLVFLFAPHDAGYWPAALVFLLLASVTCTGYFLLLRRFDHMAFDRQEIMISELCRA
jgi:ABC-2 type transport system permease protein